MSGERILAVDDDTNACEALAEVLSLWGFQSKAASDGVDAFQKALEFRPQVVLSDWSMPKQDGIWLLKNLKRELPEVPLVLLTGRGTIERAVEAIKNGAFDFIEKPIDSMRLKACIFRALDDGSKRTLPESDKAALKGSPGDSDFIGHSPAIARVMEMVRRVASAKAAVSITGESGTGKEMVARAIHVMGSRKSKPFVAINCASIPATLMESEIFGHERGAFTGADQRRQGVFELANGGTLFLDEVGEIPVELQAKLLRVIEEGRFRRLGGKAEIEIDVRLLSATNRNLEEEIKRQRFREDLYFRLNVFQLALPPLRDRLDDIPLLAQYFVEKFAKETSKLIEGISPRAKEVLSRHGWPGNVRQLRNVLERAVIMCDGRWISEEHLSPEILKDIEPQAQVVFPLGMTLDAIEKEYILQNLSRNKNNKAKTADLLGISEKTLYNKLNRYQTEGTQTLSRLP